jgi:hypothetical protein
MDSKIVNNWDSISAFDTYDEFLDSQITELDLFYVQDVYIARKLVQYGLRGNGEVISKKDYTKRKTAIEKLKSYKIEQLNATNSYDFSRTDSIEYHLAKREMANRKGILNTIIFVRVANSKNMEISSYIDYAHRLETDDLSQVYKGLKKFLPKKTDLSFYNWSTCQTFMNETRNYLVIPDDENGLLFKNKNSRSIMNFDPFSAHHDLFDRTDFNCVGYLQISFFDHFLI